MRIGTPTFRHTVSKFAPTKDMQEMRSIIEALSRKTREIYNEKRSALEKGDETVSHQIGEGKDIPKILE